MFGAIAGLTLGLWAQGQAGFALDLPLPANAVATADRNSTLEVFSAPISVFQDAGVDTVSVEGRVERSAYRISSPGLTPLQVMGPLRDALVAEGYQIALDCAARVCGGYDFRFGLETLPAPSMYVNLRSFHYVTAVRGPEAAPNEIVALLVSTAETAAHVQVVRAGRFDASAPLVSARGAVVAQEATPEPEPTGQALGDALLSEGRFILTEIEFASGTTDLGNRRSDQLQELAAFIQARPGLKLALVGHTDSTGGLDGNIAVSRKRAEAVRDRLIADYGVPSTNVQAQGMGYLAPIANNLTAAGREANRRVEVIVLGQE